MWYVVANQLSKEKLLFKAGIPVQRVNITRPRNLNRTCFPTKECPASIDLLGIVNRIKKPYNTDRTGVTYLQVSRHNQDVEVVETPKPLKEKPTKPEKTLDQLRQEYITECDKRNQEVEKTIQDNITKSEKEINNISRRMVELVRSIDENRLRLTTIQQGVNGSERFGVEFDKLLEVPHVIKVNIEKDTIHIFTDMLYIPVEKKYSITEKKETYPVGEFRIEIPTNGDFNAMKIFNVNNQITKYAKGYNHPHIPNHGKACFGNIRYGLMDLIAKYEYSVVAQIVIEYLQTAQYIETLQKRWKPVPEKTKAA